ncbi:hypothetical protein ACFQY7_49960 [Actinomadura luteofluorescens]|uniref:Uncharacterized protein n=1 Tax=Actinomadura luteofluorescens TaxID=46163 RepID=A0A7Y9EFG8_9ACTN|nr:hypothetical protein [Actinomadura luteofluorescens]NYD46662.1 hypothetical protein [Actinomadura luteofluorescens]
MSSPDNKVEVTGGVIQPETADTYDLVVDDDLQVQMKPAKKK